MPVEESIGYGLTEDWAMPQRSASSQKVQDHYERRRSAGELNRTFFVREEHMTILRRFQIMHGFPNQNAAMQALLEQFRADNNIGEPMNAAPRRRTTKPKDTT